MVVVVPGTSSDQSGEVNSLMAREEKVYIMGLLQTEQYRREMLPSSVRHGRAGQR